MPSEYSMASVVWGELIKGASPVQQYLVPKVKLAASGEIRQIQHAPMCIRALNPCPGTGEGSSEGEHLIDRRIRQLVNAQPESGPHQPPY